MKREKAVLALEDGKVFAGWSFGAPGEHVGEVVFNTSMTGYQEVLTDPSYKGQIVTMTYPEIGNTGVNPEYVESRQIFLNGFVMHQMNTPRNWRSREPLSDYLRRNGIPAIAGIDTRALTTRLRQKGTQKAFLGVTGAVTATAGVLQAKAWSGLDNQDYASLVTVREHFRWDPEETLTRSWGIADALPPADLRIVAYDFGIKRNILELMVAEGLRPIVVPASTTFEQVEALAPDGVFLSNGPGDPEPLEAIHAETRKIVRRYPTFGICLGHQILGLALGGKTYKLKFGHRGGNHPVKDLRTGRVAITSQNHGFCVNPETLGGDVEITHWNLNDNTLEGFRHKDLPVHCVQYHPEASPGPHDSNDLFPRFRRMIEASK